MLSTLKYHTNAYTLIKKHFSASSCNLFIVKVEGCVKECAVGACPRHDTVTTDDPDDPRENTCLKSEDSVKPGGIVSVRKDKRRMQTQEELVRRQRRDCCESQAEHELTVPVSPENASAKLD